MSAKKHQPIQNVIRKDAYDELIFEAVKEAPKIDPLCHTAESEGLAQDVFNALYKPEPQLSEAAPMVQRGLIDQMMKLQEFQDIRSYTQLDEISSSLGLLQFGPALLDQYEQIKQKVEERQKQAKKDKQPLPDNLEEVLSEQEMAGLRQAIRRAAEQAESDAEDWSEAVSTWGLEKGELQQLPFEERLALAEELMRSRKLSGIADMVGRFKNMVKAAGAKVPIHGSDEIVDIGYGSDISHITPSELLKLRRTPALFYKDMLEGNLQVYNLRGVDNLGKGPMIGLLDISPSMQGAREEWAKAVILALMDLAKQQKRAFGFVAFERVVHKTAFWPKENPPSAKDKIDIAQLSTSGGGTAFYDPLMKAFEMRAKDKDLKPADFVFITDGECDLNHEEAAEIADLKQKTDVRIFCFMVQEGRRPADTQALDKFCDQIYHVNSTGEIEMVKDMIIRTATDKVKKVA